MADARRASAGAVRRCPACDEPLYGWAVSESADRRRPASWILDRCEACGLGLVRDAPDGDSILAPAPDGVISAANRRSWQAGIGGGHWAALDPPHRSAYLTPRSLTLLADRAGARVAGIRQPAFGRNQLWMWQTLMNGLTFHDDFATRLLSGRLTPRDARNVPAFAIDFLVSALAAIPVALISLPLELAAVLVRRGGLLEAWLEGRGG
jgi:hypothetical protein